MKLWFKILCIMAIGNSLPVPAQGAQRPILNPGMVGDAHPTVQSTEIGLLKQGKEAFDAGRFAEAAGAWERAASSLEAKKDSRHQALTLSYLSLAYQKLGRWQQAESAMAKSLSLLQQLTKREASAYPQIIASVYNAKGYLELGLGESAKAVETWQETASYYRQAGDLQGAIGSRINQAQALQSLGMYLKGRKTLEAAISSLEEEPDSVVKSIALLSLGNALQAIGELDKSYEILQQSADMAAALDAGVAGAIYSSLGNGALALSQRAASRDQPEVAKTQREAALAAYGRGAALSSSPLERVEVELNLAYLLVDSGQMQAARRLLSQIESQLDQLPASRRTIYARINLAEILWQATQEGENLASSGKIAQILAAAIKKGEILGDDRASSYALGQLGELYAQEGRWLEAEELTRRGLVKAQAVRAGDIIYRWQWQLGRILKAQGKLPAATAAYGVAYDTLRGLRNDLVAVNPDDPDLQFSFRKSVEPVYREFVELLLTAQKGVPLSQENLLQARQVIESLQLAELDNFFRESCLDAKSISIDEVDPQAASIYGIILSDRIDAIVTLPGGMMRHYSSSVPEAEIDRTLTRLWQQIGRRSASKNEILRLSQQVYDWVIRPIEGELQQQEVKTLVFVLDGLLRNLPMAVLHDGEQYLIEKYGIAMVPGLQLIESGPQARQEVGVLTAGLSEARSGFSPLPNVERELNQILEQLQVNQSLLNQEFTSDAIEIQIKESPFPIVHIATHGQFSSQAEETFILAYDRRINVKELDALLSNRGEENAQPIELIVFSACETAAGDDRAALGLAGVAVRAGARSTLATLWQVSDDSTSRLMVEFYRQLANPGIGKAEALRRAQVSLLKQRWFSFPYFWAPYVLVGNWL